MARRFLPVWVPGLVGVASLALQAPPPLLIDSAPALSGLPEIAVRLILLVNPFVLVTAGAAVGAALADRVGLRSVLAADAGARLDARLAAIVGLAVAAVLWAVDAAVADRLGAGWQEARARADAAPVPPALLAGLLLLYGGLAEEVVMRWGPMSLVVWLALPTRSGRDGPGARRCSAAARFGVAVAAAAFAAGHLPALAPSVEPSAPIVARTLGLNLLAGVAYGWLFWRRSLETAMLAHATTHLGLALGRGLA